jgi:hypothetical protein
MNDLIQFEYNNDNAVKVKERDTMNETIIFEYNWDHAVDDGVFVDLSETNEYKESGINCPLAVTNNLFFTHINPSEELEAQGQSLQGRLWDVFTMFRIAARKSQGHDSITFNVIFRNNPKKENGENITLLAKIGARSSSNPEPVITIMLPEDN